MKVCGRALQCSSEAGRTASSDGGEYASAGGLYEAATSDDPLATRLKQAREGIKTVPAAAQSGDWDSVRRSVGFTLPFLSVKGMPSLHLLLLLQLVVGVHGVGVIYIATPVAALRCLYQ